MKTLTEKRKESGMTLIELLVALAIGAVGLSAIVGLFIIGIANNSRSKRDTTATLLAQSVLEQILLAGTTGAANIGLTDCLNNAFVINTAGLAAPGAGAAIGVGSEASVRGGAVVSGAAVV